MQGRPRAEDAMVPEDSASHGDLSVPAGAPLDPTARRLVVGDLHGDWPTLLRLLRHVGAITGDGERVPGWWLVQLGDLIHGGQPSGDDERCLADGLRLFDVLLLGNHELPHAYGGAGFPSFLGQGPLLPAALDALATAVVAGRFQVAAAVDGWLLTHAGVHPTLQERFALPTDAAACATALTDRFVGRLRRRTPDPLFDAVGQARGGVEPVGGLFWLDWHDLRRNTAANRVPQIVGPTPRPAPERAGDRLWCVDVGAARSGQVCALRRHGTDGAWEPVVVAGPGVVARRR